MLSPLFFAFALIGVVEGRVRSAQDRTTLGECADLSADYPSFFDPLLRTGTLPSETVSNHEANVTAAALISIQYHSNFKVLTEKMSKEQYVLTQCGTSPPTNEEVDAVAALGVGFKRKYFTIPLQVVMAESTVHLGFLAALGLQDRVMHLSKYAVAPCWQQALGCGAHVADSVENLAAQRDIMDGVFMDCNWDGNCSNVNSQPNAIHISVSQDPGPLHSAEHVKFIAAFFNKEEASKQHFTATAQKYTNGATIPSARPVVAWITYNAPSSWSVESYVISMATYKMEFVTAAGGKNLNKSQIVALLWPNVSEMTNFMGSTLTVATSSFHGSKGDASAALLKALAEVDAVVDETYAPDPSAYTYGTFLKNMDLDASSELKFIKNKMVFRVDGTQSPPPGNNLEWYESRLAHPDWASEGLARVLHGDASKRRKYFRNVAKGETPEVLTASMCTRELPQCVTSAYPQHIPMMLASTNAEVLGSEDVNAGFALIPSLALVVQLAIRSVVSTF